MHVLVDLYPRLSYTSWVAIASTALCLIWWYMNASPRGAPPGLNGLPFLGVIPYIRSYPERKMAEWNRRFGAVCRVKFAMRDVVLLGSVEAMNEAFAKSSDFGDRLQNGITVFDNDFGMLMINGGDFHLEQRRFGLHTLREFGMGKRSLEPRLVEIANELCARIDRLCDVSGDDVARPFPVNDMVLETVADVVSQIMFGHERSQSSEAICVVMKTLTDKNKFSVLSLITMFAPFTKHLPVFDKVYEGGIKLNQSVQDAIRKEIAVHKGSSVSHESRDFIDSYLKRMGKEKNRRKRHQQHTHHHHNNNNNNNNYLAVPHNNNNGHNKHKNSHSAKKHKKHFEASPKKPLGPSSFSKAQLIHLSKDIFMAAMDTTTIAICWTILYLSEYQTVQVKVQDEIDRVLGPSGMPTMSVLNKLPYVRAVLQEVLRIRPPVPLGLPHVASRDSTLMGYRLKKGTILLPNIWAVHHDADIWPEPDRFDPERHLDGTSGEFVKSTNVIPFSIGSRSCLGQQLANMEHFIQTVCLFRRFHFRVAPGQKVDMKGESVVTLRPYAYPLVVTRR